MYKITKTRASIVILHGIRCVDGKFSESVQCVITGPMPMSAHASQAFSIAHCTDSEDLPALIAALVCFD